MTRASADGAAARLAASATRKGRRLSRALLPTSSFTSCSRVTIPGAGIGWHRDRDVFENVVGVSLNTPAILRFRQRTASGFRRASLEVAPRSAYLLSGESRWEWEHSIAPGDSCASRSPSARSSDKGRRIAAQQPERNGPPPERFLRSCASCCCCCCSLAGCSKGPRGRSARISAQARSLAAEWALVNEQASRGQAHRRLRENDAAELREQLQTAASSLTQPNSRLCGGDPGARSPSRTTRRRKSFARIPTS